MNEQLSVILVRCFHDIHQALENRIHVLKAAAK